MGLGITILLALTVLALLAGGVILAVKASSTPTLTMEDTKSLAGGPGGGPDVLTAGITDVRKGGLVQVEGFTEPGDDPNLIIDEYNHIKAGGEVWHELATEHQGHKAAIEWHETSSGTRYYALPYARSKALKDIELDEAALEGLAEDKEIQFQNNPLKFAGKHEALFHKGESGFGKKREVWMFRNAADEFVRVERAQGEAPTVSFGRPLTQGDFSVLKVRG